MADWMIGICTERGSKGEGGKRGRLRGKEGGGREGEREGGRGRQWAGERMKGRRWRVYIGARREVEGEDRS